MGDGTVGGSTPVVGKPIGVVVVNYGSHELVEANLGRTELTPGAAHVVLVDNFAGPDERAGVAALCARRGWELVGPPTNLGFGAAVNAGARRAFELGCDSVLVLNPDAYIDGPAVDRLREHVEGDPNALVTTLLRTSGGGVQAARSAWRLRDGQTRNDDGGPPVDGPIHAWLTGAVLALHRELFERLGGFDDRYFLYWEDVDLSYRAERLGAELVVRDDLVVIHDEGGTQGPRAGRAKSDVYYYYNCRNRLLFGAQHLTRRQLVRWILTTPQASWAILLRGGRRQLLHSRSPLWACLRGSAAGLRLAFGALLRPASAA